MFKLCRPLVELGRGEADRELIRDVERQIGRNGGEGPLGLSLVDYSAIAESYSARCEEYGIATRILLIADAGVSEGGINTRIAPIEDSIYLVPCAVYQWLKV
jgi:hypothetical protein